MKLRPHPPFLRAGLGLAGCLSGLLSLFLAACGGGGGIASAVTGGPGSGGSFAGTTISINPTLEFSFGGVVRYTNTEPGSAFPAAASAIAGTYAYSPGSDFASGTLTLTLPDPVGTIVITLRNFKAQGDGAVASFDAEYGGRTFTAAVQGGKLAARPKSGSGSTSGGTSGDTAETPASAIPAALQGTRTLEFQVLYPGLAQYEGRETTAVITATTLQLGQRVLSNPVFLNGATNEWVFKDGDLWFAFSQTTGGGLSEITVTGPNGVPFYGVFLPAAAARFADSSAGAIITAAVTINGGTLTVSGASGGISKSGAGTLDLGSSNSYNGGTVVMGSNMVVNSGALSVTAGTLSLSRVNVVNSTAIVLGNGNLTSSVGSLSPTISTLSGSSIITLGSGTSLYSPGFTGGVLPYASFTTGTVGATAGGLVLAGTSTISPLTLASGTLALATPLSNPLLVNGGNLVLNYPGVLISNTVSAGAGPAPVATISLAATSLLPGSTVTVSSPSTTLLLGSYTSFSAIGTIGSISATSIQVDGTLSLNGASYSNPLLLQNSDGQSYRLISTASQSSDN